MSVMAVLERDARFLEESLVAPFRTVPVSWFMSSLFSVRGQQRIYVSPLGGKRLGVVETLSGYGVIHRKRSNCLPRSSFLEGFRSMLRFILSRPLIMATGVRSVPWPITSSAAAAASSANATYLYRRL